MSAAVITEMTQHQTFNPDEEIDKAFSADDLATVVTAGNHCPGG